MLFFKFSNNNNNKVFDEKLESLEFRIEYLCNADSILFCSICYNDALIKLEKLKEVAEETHLPFDYDTKLKVFKELVFNCFDSALAKEIEKILDDFVKNENIDRFQDRIENLESDYTSNKNFFSSAGDSIYRKFIRESNHILENYRELLFFK